MLKAKSETILIISSEFPPGPGGIGQHAASLAIALSAKRNVVVLCNQDYVSSSERAFYSKSLEPGIRIINYSNKIGVISAVKKVRYSFYILKDVKPSKVIVTGRFQLWVGFLIKFFNRDIIVEGIVHGSEVGRLKSLDTRFTHFVCKRLNKIWAVSRFTSSLLLAGGVSNVEVLPNGIDDLLLKEEYTNFSSMDWIGYPLIITVGNVTYRKGQQRVIKALPVLLKKYPELHYHIVGLPTESEAFIKLAEKLGVLDSITFHGRMTSRDDLYKAYRTSDLFIMLSENQPDGDVEGFGIALLEANVFEVPTIGAIGCGIEDAISIQSGILVDGDSPSDILSAIDVILSNYEHYQKGARQWAEEHNWSKIVLRM